MNKVPTKPRRTFDVTALLHAHPELATEIDRFYKVGDPGFQLRIEKL